MAARQTNSADSSVEGLVHSIQKSKTFKRLAGYSIECLNKLINPTASDWLEQSGLAVKLGAVPAIVDVLANPSTSDAGIFIQATKAVAILASSSSRAGQSLCDVPSAVGTIINAFVYYWDTTLPSLTDSRKQLSAEDRQSAYSTAESFAGIVATVAKHGPRVLTGVPAAIPALCRLIVPDFGTPTSSSAPKLSLFHPPAASLAFQALTLVWRPFRRCLRGVSPLDASVLCGCTCQIARSKEGLASLAEPEIVLAVMASCGNLSRLIESGAVSTSEGLRGLEPPLKLLERFAWDDVGLDVLRRLVAAPSYAAFVALAFCNPVAVLLRQSAVTHLSSTVHGLKRVGADTLAAIGIRILGRVIGSNLTSLLDTIATSSSPTDAEFASSLLASLMNQRDMADSIVASGGVPRLVLLLESTKLSTACLASICTSLRCGCAQTNSLFPQPFSWRYLRDSH
jgi:hypothetical protein